MPENNRIVWDADEEYPWECDLQGAGEADIADLLAEDEGDE